MPRQIIDPESGDKRFDAKVHVRDHRGTQTDVRPYQKIVRDGVAVFRDKNGYYYEDGSDVPPKVLLQLGLVKPKQEATKPQQQVPQDHPQTDPVDDDELNDEQVTPGDEEDEDPEPPADDQGSTGL